MTGRSRSGLGRPQAVLAVLIAGVAVAATVATASTHHGVVIRLSLFGLGLFALSVFGGWSLGSGLAVVPGLGGAVVEMTAVATQGWLRAAVIGCLWYVACETGWDAVDRRDGHDRPAPVTRRRVEEVGTVVVVSLAVILVSLTMIDGAPARSLPVRVVALVVTVAALGATGRHIRHAA